MLIRTLALLALGWLFLIAFRARHMEAASPVTPHQAAEGRAGSSFSGWCQRSDRLVSD
jgi:hypothetical protein